MNTSRFLSWAALLALWACSVDPSESDSPVGGPLSQSDGHRVPVASALAELQAVLEDIDGPQTRSGGPRSVGTVASVKASAGLPATRSGEMSGVEDLVYIANFENGKGYAILGADDRLASVIAVTEQGSLAPEEYAAVARGEYDGCDTPPVRPEVVAYTLDLGAGDGNVPIFPPILPPPVELTYETYGSWQYVTKIGPLVPVKWNQEEPYNYYMKGYYMGCVAVATAQLITAQYYRHRNLRNPPEKINGTVIDWATIFRGIEQGRIRFKPEEITAESKAVASLIFEVGVYLRTAYGPIGSKGSPANDEHVQNLLNALGFTRVKYGQSYNPDLAETMMTSYLSPVVVSAPNSLSNSAHTWLLDGVYKQKCRVETRRQFTNELISVTTAYRTLFHCNFGYNGDCDGYYYSWCFDLRKGPEEKDAGDNGGTPQRDYTRIYSSTYHVSPY